LDFACPDRHPHFQRLIVGAPVLKPPFDCERAATTAKQQGGQWINVPSPGRKQSIALKAENNAPFRFDQGHQIGEEIRQDLANTLDTGSALARQAAGNSGEPRDIDD
jgi:hypothetical protein